MQITLLLLSSAIKVSHKILYYNCYKYCSSQQVLCYIQLLVLWWQYYNCCKYHWNFNNKSCAATVRRWKSFNDIFSWFDKVHKRGVQTMTQHIRNYKLNTVHSNNSDNNNNTQFSFSSQQHLKLMVRHQRCFRPLYFLVIVLVSVTTRTFRPQPIVLVLIFSYTFTSKPMHVYNLQRAYQVYTFSK